MGSGLASWLALPIATLGIKRHRKIWFYAIWLTLASIVIVIYQSQIATPLATLSTGSRLESLANIFADRSIISGLLTAIKIPIFFVARAWIPPAVWDGTYVDILILFASAALIGYFAFLIVHFFVIRANATAWFWAGVASYSFIC